MKITIVTPAGKGERSGNRATAVRWARLMRKLGHKVDIATDYDGGSPDLLVAIHAWRSAGAVERFRQAHPVAPLIVGLAGTDIYQFQHSHGAEVHRSMALADLLVCLHDLVHRSIPADFHRKLHVIRQSAASLCRVQPGKRHFDLLVIGHLRDVKDPFRAALATRTLPVDSRIRVLQMGKAVETGFAAQAAEEMRTNPRFRWRGELPRANVRRHMARARAMVISSRSEGGANVVSEAIMAGLPILASRIDGNVGLLGSDYRGYFPVEDTETLRSLMLRFEREPSFRGELSEQIAARARLHTEDAEVAAWRSLLDALTRPV